MLRDDGYAGSSGLIGSCLCKWCISRYGYRFWLGRERCEGCVEQRGFEALFNFEVQSKDFLIMQEKSLYHLESA